MPMLVLAQLPPPRWRSRSGTLPVFPPLSHSFSPLCPSLTPFTLTLSGSLLSMLFAGFVRSLLPVSCYCLSFVLVLCSPVVQGKPKRQRTMKMRSKARAQEKREEYWRKHRK